MPLLLMNKFWRSRAVRVFLFLAAVLLLAGCPYESQEPLGSPSGGSVDEKLLGRWRLKDTENNEAGFLTISRFNNTEMLIVVEEEGKKTPDIMRGFVTDVEGRKFMNLQEIRGEYKERKWIFVNYKTEACTLAFKVINDSLVPHGSKARLTSRQLFDAVKANLGNQKIYDEESTLRCAGR